MVSTILDMLLSAFYATVSIFVVGAMFKKNITIVNVWMAMFITYVFWNMCLITLMFVAMYSGYAADFHFRPDGFALEAMVYGVVFYNLFAQLKNGSLKMYSDRNGLESNEESKDS